jgi:hypothetical protein
MLRAGADGARHIEAAVNLLIADGFWLDHGGFRDRCVIHDPELSPDVAGIDWTACRGLEVHSDDLHRVALLMVASELAGTGTGVTLVDLLGSLDDDGAELVLRAVGHVLGYRMGDPEAEAPGGERP